MTFRGLHVQVHEYIHLITGNESHMWASRNETHLVAKRVWEAFVTDASIDAHFFLVQVPQLRNPGQELQHIACSGTLGTETGSETARRNNLEILDGEQGVADSPAIQEDQS